MKSATSAVRTVARGGGDAAELSGHPVEVLIGALGQGGVTMYEAETQPGEGTPMHVQAGDSYLYVIAGVYQIFAGERVTVAGAGTAVFVPGGIAHGFTNIGENTARLLGFTTEAVTKQAAREEESVPMAARHLEYGFQLCMDCGD